MKYSKSISLFLLFLGVFSLAMNLYYNRTGAHRGPASMALLENERGANANPPWWITH